MLELLDVQRKEASASAFMFVHQEDEVNLWGIQESIDDAERVLDVAVTRASKLQTLLAMATDGVKNVIGQFLEIERREKEEEEEREQRGHLRMEMDTTEMEVLHSSGREEEEGGGGGGDMNGDMNGAGSLSSSQPGSRPASPRASHHYHNNHHHHHRHHRHHQSSLAKKEAFFAGKDILALLDVWKENIASKEKIMHQRVGTILAGRARRFCPHIGDLEFSKKGREFVKMKCDTLLALRSIGLGARRKDPQCLSLPRLMLQNIQTIQKSGANRKQTLKSPSAASAVSSSSSSPFGKKKGRRKSKWAAARQMKASRKLKNITAILKKKKAIDLLENLDMLQDFLMTSGGDRSGVKSEQGGDTKPGWTDSKYNWRVKSMEHAGRAPPTVDSKELTKKWDPEEDGMLHDMRKTEKVFSKSLIVKSTRTKRRSRQSSSSIEDVQGRRTSKKKNNNNNKMGGIMGETKNAADEYSATSSKDRGGCL